MALSLSRAFGHIAIPMTAWEALCNCCNANADGIPRGEMSSYEDVTTSCEPHNFCLFSSKPPLHVLKRFSCSLFSFSLVSSDSFERAFKNVIHSMVGNPRECFPEESS